MVGENKTEAVSPLECVSWSDTSGPRWRQPGCTGRAECGRGGRGPEPSRLVGTQAVLQISTRTRVHLNG